MGAISAAWLNAIIANTNSILGTTIANVATGQAVQGSIFVNMISQATTAATTLDYELNWPPTSYFGIGQPVHLYAFPNPVHETGTRVSWNVPGTYTWTVPTGCHSLCVNWCLGGGGGGGASSSINNGGGGTGGSAGAWSSYVQIPCNPGDVLTVTVGAGGLGAAANTLTPGGNGGLTTVALNGAVLVSSPGGPGGPSTPNTGKGQVLAPATTAGNGLAGQTGQSGASDTSSSYGGGGAPGPLQGSYGGAAGLLTPGAVNGSNGVGYGSGGGGGSNVDRSSTPSGSGGNGAPGYVEITWPSQLPSQTGTPSWDNSGYNVGAVLVAGAQAGGYTGGSGIAPYDASGIHT